MFSFNLLLLLIPWVSAQVTQCGPDGSPQLRFAAQLSVSGCAIFVHDTGASDGPHLAVEPIMCVTESLHNVTSRYDPLTQQTYVSVPVTLRDDAMLAEVQRQLRHLSPKSVKFATVSDISVPSDASSKFQALGFDWTPEESTVILRLGCENVTDDWCAIRTHSFALWANEANVLSQVKLKATIASINIEGQQFSYSLMMQNMSSSGVTLNSERYCLPRCQQLRFIRSIRLSNCTARVHQRLDMKRHFLIEPLLCHNITSMSNESVVYDYSRDKYYLKLDVLLQDDVTADAVRTQLADLSPRSVAFMRLWRAQSHVAPALSRSFEIGPLMVSGDGRSAQLRVYCSAIYDCTILRQRVLENSLSLWRQIRWTVTSLLESKCTFASPALIRFGSTWVGKATTPSARFDWNQLWEDRSPKSSRWLTTSQFLNQSDSFSGRHFVVIQQRKSGRVRFQRTWIEYEAGFGDDVDFWIGLSTIHWFSQNGTTLVVEMKLWDTYEVRAEYAGFRVGDASTNYTMTYREMLRDWSGVRVDAMEHFNGMQFSTMDRDNYNRSSNKGQGGWWFNDGLMLSNPNGIFSSGDTDNRSYCGWHTGFQYNTLRAVRLMLQV